MSHHLAVAGLHGHYHSHQGPHGETWHSHPHQHDSDNDHISSDRSHGHQAGEHELGEPPAKKTYPVQAAAHEVAMAYTDDEVLIGLSAGQGDGGHAGLTAADLAAAELELAGVSAAAEADSTAAEIFRYQVMADEDALRAQGRRF
jgi:hypothetical protein